MLAQVVIFQKTPKAQATRVKIDTWVTASQKASPQPRKHSAEFTDKLQSGEMSTRCVIHLRREWCPEGEGTLVATP